MNRVTLPALALRARLSLAAFGPLRCVAAAGCLGGAIALAWLLPQQERLAREHQLALARAAVPPVVEVSAPVVANQNLTLFYGTLGERRYAEQQVRTLFALAGKSGLSLSQGEYQSTRDANAALTTYQITLPVKGSYRAIWQFGLAALRAMPFASLDEISFKREAIGEANVEARLRFTLYLGEGGAR
jgi:hypothetical protein